MKGGLRKGARDRELYRERERETERDRERRERERQRERDRERRERERERREWWPRKSTAVVFFLFLN